MEVNFNCFLFMLKDTYIVFRGIPHIKGVDHKHSFNIYKKDALFKLCKGQNNPAVFELHELDPQDMTSSSNSRWQNHKERPNVEKAKCNVRESVTSIQLKRS